MEKLFHQGLFGIKKTENNFVKLGKSPTRQALKDVVKNLLLNQCWSDVGANRTVMPLIWALTYPYVWVSSTCHLQRSWWCTDLGRVILSEVEISAVLWDQQGLRLEEGVMVGVGFWRSEAEARKSRRLGRSVESFIEHSPDGRREMIKVL
jgi:hypothetical protein